MNRVVITGMGIHSCIGTSLEEVKSSLYHGKSGIILDEPRKDFGFRSALTGMVNEPELKGELSRRQRIGMPQQAKYAYKATQQALEMAHLDINFLAKNETGILYGNDSSAKAVMEAIDQVRIKKDTTLLGSGSIFQSMNCTVTMNLSTIFKLKGINFTVSAACASGSHAIGLAFLFIQQGWQDRILCGGAQEINEYAMGSFDGLGVFSVDELNPTQASKPFDKRRDGLIPSGGAASLVLESLESAQTRGANILAEVVGYGYSSNGDHISNPSREGQLVSLSRALKQAQLNANDIDYINAHATSTPMGDLIEAQSIHEIFGSKIPVSSTKSMTGHECWMAGASEVIYSLLMMQEDFVAPNINFEESEEDMPKINIINKTKHHSINHFLSNSFGFGGTNSTVIIKKYNG